MKIPISTRILRLKNDNPDATTVLLGKVEYRELSGIQNCMERTSKKAFGLDVEVLRVQSHLEVK